jgi:hypothetical protein
MERDLMTRIVFSIDIAPSKIITIYLMIIHSLMLVTLISLFPTPWWVLFIFIFMVLNFIYFDRQTQAFIKLERDVDDVWSCYYQNNKSYQGLKLTSSIVVSSLVILYFKGHHYWQRYRVIIVRDSVDAKLFRQLRMHCRDSKTFQK